MEIIDFLQEYDIEYWTSGKNVGRGKINIQCPFCDDSSNHCGIDLRNLKVMCWRCGSHSFINLAMELAGLTKKEAYRIKKEISLGAGIDPLEESKSSSRLTLNKTLLPLESTKSFSKKFLNYLRARGFIPPTNFVRKYNLLATHPIGKYKFRIIIPIYINHKLVSFTSRDITGDQSPLYLSATEGEGIMNIKHTIYNYDNLTPGSDVILVEGPCDVWKMGDGSASILGVKFTDKQIILLKKKEINTLFIIFDYDAAGINGAKNLAGIMAPLVKRIEIINFKTINDPGDLSLDEASILKYRIGFRS